MQNGSPAKILIYQYQMEFLYGAGGVFYYCGNAAHALCAVAIGTVARYAAGQLIKLQPACVWRAGLALYARYAVVKATVNKFVFANEKHDLFRPYHHGRNAVARAVYVYQPSVAKQRICGC